MPALMVWYLLTPPVIQTGGMLAVTGWLPLAKWDTQGTYDSSDACEKARVELKEQNPVPKMWDRGDTERNYHRQALRDGRCVSSDDPKLKTK